MATEKIGLNAREAAEVLGVSPRTIAKLAAEGKIPKVKVGGRVVFPRHLLLRWLEDEARRQQKRRRRG